MPPVRLSGQAPVAEILDALAAEAEAAAALAWCLQAAVADAATTSGLTPRAVEALQGVDALSQRLDGAAAFLRALAPSAPGGWMLDAGAAAGEVRLGDLARRLACQGAHRAAPEHEAGALELFEGP